MTWRISQAESRQRYLRKFDAAEVESYDTWIRQMDSEDVSAYLDDLQDVCEFRAGMKVLDAGAGTGAMCLVLNARRDLQLTALEPSPEMIDCLRKKTELSGVLTVQGFCDAAADRDLFATASFDVIVSRQLFNGLYDPLTAFKNWRYWLKPGGTVILIDGFYERSAWSGKWTDEVDQLPASACQSLAMAPYLLETAGFQIAAVSLMSRTNARPSTRTKRYLVVAR